MYIYNIIVFRRIKGIQGLTREIIIGLTTNIESQELRRCEYQTRDLVPEHPRASSTDDVEGLVGMLHDMFGPVFSSGRYDTEVINSAPIFFFFFFFHLCRAVRVVEEPAEETTTSGK